MLKKVITVVGVLLISAVVVWAQQTSPNAVNGGIYQATPPALSDKQPGVFQLDTSGNLKVTTTPQTSSIQSVKIDQTTPGTTNLVSAGQSEQITDNPTVQAAVYSAGNCIGGFRQVGVVNNAGQSGFITNVRVLSQNASTSTITLYLFDSNPSTSTCTDKSTFSISNADLDKLIVSPTSATLAVPAAGMTQSVASFEFAPPRPFIAGGVTSSSVRTIYYGLATSAMTPSSTSDIHVRMGVVLN